MNDYNGAIYFYKIDNEKLKKENEELKKENEELLKALEKGKILGVKMDIDNTIPKLSDFYKNLNLEFAGKPYYEGVEIDIANKIDEFTSSLIGSGACHVIFAEDLQDILTENILAVVMQMLRGIIH